MRAAWKAVLFDLDGTLIETAPEIANAVNDTLAHLGLAPVEQSLVDGWIGHGTGELLVKALAYRQNASLQAVRLSPELAAIRSTFNGHYQSRCGTSSQLYPGVRETLVALREGGCRLAVVTNKEAHYTDIVLRAHDLLPLRYPQFSPLLAYHLAYVPLVLHRAVRVLCNSEATAREVHGRLGVSARRLEPIRLGFDPGLLRPLGLEREPFFLVLGRQCGPSSGADRTSLMFSLRDEAGALHRALAPFRRFRINMTKIESRPSKRKAWEYFFFADIDGHAEDTKVAKAIEMLGQHCSFVKILGSYPNGE